MPKKNAEKKKAVIVVGPESSGTRLITRLCIAAGCYGDAQAVGKYEYRGWPQKWDAFDPDGETPIVIRRTLPYHPYRAWFDLDALVKRFKALKYDIVVIIAKRDRKMVAKSQVAHGYVATFRRADAVIEEAEKRISGMISNLKPKSTVCNYEKLIKSPLAEANKMLKAAGLKTLKKLPEKVFDGNKKYTEE